MNKQVRTMFRSIGIFLFMICSSMLVLGKEKATTPQQTSPPKQLFSGNVVLRTESKPPKRTSASKTIKKIAYLKTDDGKYIPIKNDWRGRAFLLDKQLRNRKIELIGIQHHESIQVLVVYTFNKNGKRQYTDYWCEVCAIPMYEPKLCECCQDKNVIRFQHKKLPDWFKPVKTKNK